jgi:hypothetical protein
MLQHVSVGMVSIHVKKKKPRMYRIKAMNISTNNVHRILKNGCALLQRANHSVCHKRMGLTRGDAEQE